MTKQEQLKTRLLTDWIKERFYSQVELIMSYGDDMSTCEGKADYVLAEAMKVNIIIDRVESIGEVEAS